MAYCRRYTRSRLSVEKKLSTAALSQQSSFLLMLQVALIGKQPLKVFGRILAALVGMVQQLDRPASSPDRHEQRIGD